MERVFAIAGAVAAMIGVIVGAFGAHELRGRLSPADLEIFETGVRYHMYHALGLFAVAWAASRWPSGATTLAGWLLIVGIVVFSGSLYTPGAHGSAVARSCHTDRRSRPDRGLGCSSLGRAAQLIVDEAVDQTLDQALDRPWIRHGLTIDCLRPRFRW